MLTLIQMSGVPGSGKSTLAKAIAPELKALVLDHDDTKSAILAIGVENDLAGQASYSVIKVLATRFLSEGTSVIIDSPCLYAPLLKFGQSVANELGAKYKYIECRLEDLETLDSRLRQRPPRPSQIIGIDSKVTHRGSPPREAKTLIEEWATNMKRPKEGYLVLDTAQPIAVNLKRAIEYVIA